MKLMNRCLAFSLGLLLTLHSFYLPAWASELDEEVDLAEIVEDILIDPAELPLEAGIAPASLGLTLTVGQIAALIAGGIGTVYAATNWDALGSHLQTALNDAASSVTGGPETLLNWWNAAITGDISLSKVTLAGDIWIAKTILDVMYNIHQGLSYPQAPFYGEYALPVPGSILPAGTPIYTTGPYIKNSDGSFYRSNPYIFDFDVIPLLFYYYSGTTVKYETYVFNPSSNSFGQVSSNGGSSWYEPTNYSVYTDDATGMRRSYMCVMSAGCQLSTTAQQRAFTELIAAGGIEVASSSEILPKLKEIISLYLAGEVIDGYGAYPDDVSVCPDALVGGISQAWTDQGVGTDVIDLPDILIDGSGIISADEAGSIDVSLGDALDDVATGELTWDDLWLDISGTKPEITVKDDAAEDVGGPITLPDWFVDFCDRLTGSADDRNDKIDSLLPGLGDGMALIDDFESDILDQFNNAFNDLDLDAFHLSSGILAALTWLVYWVVQFFNASGDLQVVILLPMLLGLALLFIGRGSMAMQRVEASHLKASLKKDGGGSS